MNLNPDMLIFVFYYRTSPGETKNKSSTSTTIPGQSDFMKHSYRSCRIVNHTVLSGPLQRRKMGKWLKARSEGSMELHQFFFSFLLTAFLRKTKPLSSRRSSRLLKHLPSLSWWSWQNIEYCSGKISMNTGANRKIPVAKWNQLQGYPHRNPFVFLKINYHHYMTSRYFPYLS